VWVRMALGKSNTEQSVLIPVIGSGYRVESEIFFSFFLSLFLSSSFLAVMEHAICMRYN
jgi:hypothetical protein